VKGSPRKVDSGESPIANVAQAVHRLQEAARSGVPCPPVRDLIGSDDLAAAYAVQAQCVLDRVRSGARIVGHKLGLTSPAVQAQLGVDRPDFGVLLDDMEYADGAGIPMTRLLQPKVEAEIAFVLGADLERDITPAAVQQAVDHAVVALEVVDSRIADWDISFGDTVADNASSGLFVLGGEHLSLADFEPRAATVEMYVDGRLASTGSGTACLGDPLEAVAWLARTAQVLGDPLRAGHIVLSGALGPMVPVVAGQRVRADLATGDGRPLASVTTHFTEETP